MKIETIIILHTKAGVTQSADTFIYTDSPLLTSQQATELFIAKIESITGQTLSEDERTECTNQEYWTNRGNDEVQMICGKVANTGLFVSPKSVLRALINKLEGISNSQPAWISRREVLNLIK